MNDTLIHDTARPWIDALLRMGILLGAVFSFYWSTFQSMVGIWEQSETYTHGFLVFPISLWLIWNARNRLAMQYPQTDWRGLILLAIAGAGWLLADAGGVQVVMQYAFITMLVASVWVFLGLHVVRALFFPLMFLFFAVPAGDFAIPTLRNFTTSFVVAALHITHIPVFREGTNLSVPNGNWSVVDACSGIRFLIASITLGTLYAYLSYTSWSRRLIFVLLSIIVPILANGLRAYTTVMIGYLSGMKYGVGFDHIVYGWVLFGAVMFLLFLIGNFFHEDQGNTNEKNADEGQVLLPLNHGHGWKSVLVCALLILLVWPGYAIFLERKPLPDLAQFELMPTNDWRAVQPITDWHPHWLGADRNLLQSYSNGKDQVLLALDYYATQRQNAELINSQNYMVGQSRFEHWHDITEKLVTVDIAGKPTQVRQALLESNDADPQRLLVWQWNVVDGVRMLNDYYTKLIMALDKVRLDRDDGTSILIAAQYNATPEEAADKLKRFIKDNELGIMQAIAHIEAK
jgi:exosortase A